MLHSNAFQKSHVSCTLFRKEVNDGIQFTATIQISHLRARFERKIKNAKPSLATT